MDKPLTQSVIINYLEIQNNETLLNKNYHSPYMVQVAEKLSILKMTPEERANYSYYQKKLYSDRDELAVIKDFKKLDCS